MQGCYLSKAGPFVRVRYVYLSQAVRFHNINIHLWGKITETCLSLIGLSRYKIIFKYSSNFVVSFYSNKMLFETYAVNTINMRNNPMFKIIIHQIYVLQYTQSARIWCPFSNIHCAILLTPDLSNVVIAYDIGQCTRNTPS